MTDANDEREALVNQALGQADALVTQVIRGEASAKFALELARTLNEIKRKFPQKSQAKPTSR